MNERSRKERLSLCVQKNIPGWVSLLMGLTVLACGRPAADVGGGERLGARSDEVKIITAATPGIKDFVLQSTHEGFGNADCASCHGSFHNSYYGPADCAQCHGTNGSPALPQTHPSASCEQCHAAAHPELQFKAPQDCTACHRYATPPTECTETANYDVVVIGSGGGGLSAAATLARAGQKVLVVERNHKVGGYMADFRRGDYRFEVSLHGFDGLDPVAGINKNMLADLGIAAKVKPIKIQPYIYRVVHGGVSVDIPADLDRFRDVMATRFPHEKAGIEKLFKDIKELGKIVEKVQGGDKGWFDYPKGVWPWELIRLMGVMNNTFDKYMAGFIKDPVVVNIISQLVLYVVVPPDDMSAVLGVMILYGYHVGGFYYFEGGSQAVANAMAEVIRDNGGTIKLNTLATKILIQDGKATEVQTANGGCFRARYVVSNANAPQTLFQLVGKQYLAQDYVAKVEKMKQGASGFFIYLGVDKDYADVFGNTHEIFVSPPGGLKDNFTAVTECNLEKMGYGLGSQSLIDPTMAPKGKSIVSIAAISSMACFEKWGATGSYAAYNQTKDKLVEYFLLKLEKFIPDIRQHIEVMEVGTPQTLYNYSLNPGGNFMGYAFTRDQNIDKRLAQQTPIPNLYLAGAWTFPGGGQSMVLMSGQTAAKAILAADQKANP